MIGAALLVTAIVPAEIGNGRRIGLIAFTESASVAKPRTNSVASGPVVFGAADRLRAEFHFPIPPREREGVEAQLRELRMAQSEDEFQKLYAQGKAMSLEDAVREILNAGQ